MPDNKLVIRRLPPSMNEDDFLKHISPLPEHDYLCFFEANSGLGPHSFSRAYINFMTAEDMAVFRERFDNYIFLDKDGHEYPAVVEQSLWHRSPKNGPFYTSSDHIESDSIEVNLINNHEDPKSSVNVNSSQRIQDDPDYCSFIEKLQKKRPQHSPIQTLEANLDELTSTASSASLNSKDGSRVMTPLLGYINQRRNIKITKRAK